MNWQITGSIMSKTAAARRQEIIEILLASRGLKTAAEKQAFFNPPPPDSLTVRQVGISSVQLTKAVNRVVKAIKNKEKIIVYGDYDTDGVTATALVWEALEKLGADALPFIPRREEGYGLKAAKIDELAGTGVSLIITVDQGIVQNEAVAHAHKQGVDIIVTDHHQPGKFLPKAYAIVHTTKLAGVGVAWFFAKELLVSNASGVARRRPRLLRGENSPTSKVNQVPTLEFSLDLATIGTITDMVPLLGPNRSLVAHGLQAVRETRRPGLLALFELAGIVSANIGTYEVGYLVGPRLNASGRVEDPMDALRLICTRDPDRAYDLAVLLENRNRDRQQLTEQTVSHARKLWLEGGGHEPFIFVHHASYQEGVVGLVASRLMEEFYRPVVVMAEGGQWSKASARSIAGFNIIEAIRACAADLGAHGGHPRAAGFSVKTAKISLVKEKLLSLAGQQLNPEKLQPILRVDAEIALTDCTPELYRELEQFAPFGMENPTPTFASRGVKVVDARPVGRDAKHLTLKFQIPNSKYQIKGIAFNFGHLSSTLKPGQTVDLAYQLLYDEWNGRRQLQLKVKDINVRD